MSLCLVNVVDVSLQVKDDLSCNIFFHY